MGAAPPPIAEPRVSTPQPFPRELVVRLRTEFAAGLSTAVAMDEEQFFQRFLRGTRYSASRVFTDDIIADFASPTSQAASAARPIGSPSAVTMASYFAINAPEDELVQIAEIFSSRPEVAAAYVAPKTYPAVAGRLNDMEPSLSEPPEITPSFVAHQGYLDPPPSGVNAFAGRELKGGNGERVTIIDIEGDWNGAHENLTSFGGRLETNSPPEDGWRNHGTAVGGVLIGNGVGSIGIAPLASLRGIPLGNLRASQAITVAAANLQLGDIILIEVHRPGPRSRLDEEDESQRGYIALEWWEDIATAIHAVTNQGIIVVEAAGNGGENLDDPFFNHGIPGFSSAWRNPFDRSLFDTRSILVGAGAPPPHGQSEYYGPARSRLDFSNYGNSVDCQGWGRSVTTTGYGDLQGGSSEDRWYTNTFSGTSSAAPMVAGALACVQSILKEEGLSPLLPLEARNLLRSTGTPQQDGPYAPAAQQRIGNLPDIAELLDKALQLRRE